MSPFFSKKQFLQNVCNELEKNNCIEPLKNKKTAAKRDRRKNDAVVLTNLFLQSLFGIRVASLSMTYHPVLRKMPRDKIKNFLLSASIRNNIYDFFICI